jgi:hypothetical protein
MEISHKKLKVILTMPEVFTGQDYIKYFEALEQNADKYKGATFYVRSYLAAVAVCVDAKLDGQDLKVVGLDAPMRVIKWVADSITEYINKEMEIPEA